MLLPQRPEPRPGVLAIEAYVPGKSAAPGVAKVHKLSSNETPLGPRRSALAAMQRRRATLELYPDGSATQLREAIAAKYGLDPARIVCGAGSDELLSLLDQRLCRAGRRGPVHGARLSRLPHRDPRGRRHAGRRGGDGLHRRRRRASSPRVTPRTKIVFLANPNNPTGTYLPFDEVKRLHAGLPPHVLLVLDAAYAEYVRRNDYASGLELVATAENVVMTRTFSKIYGLADLRLGWMVGPAHVVDAREPHPRALQRQRPRASLPGVAALADEAHVGSRRRAQRALAALADARDRGARPRA